METSELGMFERLMEFAGAASNDPSFENFECTFENAKISYEDGVLHVTGDITLDHINLLFKFFASKYGWKHEPVKEY